MKFEFEKTPVWLRLLVPFVLWRKAKPTDHVYLTFDDGPTADVTDAVLEILRSENVMATFFLLGKHVIEHPDLANRILAEGHAIGNHGYQHISGWNTSLSEYLRDVRAGQQALLTVLKLRCNTFRPPFGQLGIVQGIVLWWTQRIIMWDVVAQDYRQDLSPQQVVEIVLRHTTSGSIVLMHDSQLAEPRVLEALPVIIKALKSKGLKLDKLP